VRILRPTRPRRAHELWYRDKLLWLVGHVRGLLAVELEKLKEAWPVPRAGDSVAIDADEPKKLPPIPPPEVVHAVEAVRRQMPGLEEWAVKTATGAAERNAAAVDESVAGIIQRQLRVDVRPVLHAYGPLSQPVSEAVNANVSLIKTIPGEYLDRVKETMAEAWEQGIGFEQAGKMIEADFDATEGRAKLIAEDQTGKMASAFNRERQMQLGLEKYRWNCTHRNTRETHLEVESRQTPLGKGVYRWDEPGPLLGTIDGQPCHPGSDIRCHCSASPVLELSDFNPAFWNQAPTPGGT
jgi:uncharacterized protein with gpF-like domain